MLQRPFDARVPFTTREFRAAGHDVARLRTREFLQVFRDVHVLAGVPLTTLLRARAALKVAGPRAHVSHGTAAEIYDLAPPEHPGVDVSTPEGVTRTRTDGIRAHLANPGAVVVTRHGLAISSPIQAFLDLAGLPGMRLVDLAIVGDRLVAKKLATCEELIAAADAWRGRGARLARRVARLVRKDVDSPMETRLRLLIVLAGLPEPKVNHILRHANGEWNVRLDLSYPDQKVLVEYDGRQHANDPPQWLRDIDRRELLERLEWRTVTVTAEGIFKCPARTLRRVEATLRERGVPGLPRRMSDEWRHHFTVGS
jgi:very-short-patch-repair endonuclease